MRISNFQSFKPFNKTNEGNLNVANRPEHVLDASKLHYDKESKTFSTEVSDLGRSFNPLYVNRKEIITIMNVKTGQSCDYEKFKDERDGEGELMYTVYKPAYNSIGRGTTLLVFND